MKKIRPDLPLLRLFQLISPSIPIGGFAYSQGLEFAVETGWITNASDVEKWLLEYIHSNFYYLDLPIMKRMYDAIQHEDLKTTLYWCQYLFASRETSELRLEEQNKGIALNRLIKDLGIHKDSSWDEVLSQTLLCPYTLASVEWSIPLNDSATGYVWSWVENQVTAAIKLVPLGQTSGQKLLLKIAEVIPKLVHEGLEVSNDQIGASSPAIAIASSLHETQYTRLFRS